MLELLLIEVLALVFLLVLFKRKRQDKEIKTKKRFKPEQIIMFLIYATVFLIIAYLFVSNVFPNSFLNSGTYEIKASDANFLDALNSLSIDQEGVLGEKTEIDGETVRKIISEKPFNILFNPKKVITDNTPATLTLSFLYPNTDVYLNDKLIIPNLNNYVFVKAIGNKQVYVKKDLEKSSYKTATTAEDFIYKNFPQQSIYSFAEYSSGMPILSDYSDSQTRIKTQFRGNLKMAVYAEDTLEISFTKKDLNSYVGKDEYTLTITDSQDKQIFKRTFEDDGDKKDSSEEGDEQDFSSRVYDLKKGIYYLNFIREDGNKYDDSTIKDLKINTNKILFLDRCLPLDEFEFYTYVGNEKTIGFYYWHTNADQKVYQTGQQDEVIDLNVAWKSKRYNQELDEKGDYSFELEKGDVWLYFDEISPSKESWFNLPIKTSNKVDSDVIIFDSNKISIKNNKVIYLQNIKVSEDTKFKLQVLDKDKIYFNKVKLDLEL